MITKYIWDYEERIDGDLREERPIDKTLRPNADRYILLSDIAPHIRYILEHESWDRHYDAHMQELYSLVES